MKLSRWLTLLLALLSAGLLTGASLALGRESDHVTVRREVLAGDPSAAAGVELTFPMSCQEQLFWTSILPADRPEDVRTTFATHLTHQPNYPTWDSSPLDLTPAAGRGNGSTSYFYDVDGEPLDALIRQVLADTPPNGSHTETFVLADWYDSWPLEVSLSRAYLSRTYQDGASDQELNELFWSHFATSTPSDGSRAENSVLADCYDSRPLEVSLPRTYPDEPSDQELNELFQSYFSIPIPPDVTLEITAETDSEGGLRRAVIVPHHSYYIEPTTYSVERDSGLIFTLTNTCRVNEADGSGYTLPLDGSRIPGGWGIYRLTPGLTLETLWSLPEGAQILEFWGEADGEDLFLLTREEGQLRLRIFDGAVNLLQTHDLLPLSEAESYMQTYRGEDFFVPILYGPRDEGYCCRFAVVAKAPEGWVTSFTGDDRQADALGRGGFSWTEDYRSAFDMDFDGTRLAILDGSFYLSVYSRDGLDYLADYTVSLDQEVESMGENYAASCHLLREDGMKLVRWAETAP